MLLVQLQEAGIQLSKDQLAILAKTIERINFGLGAFTVTTNALFQADGVEVYDSDCDDVPNAQPSFMANISSYGSDALAKVHNPDNVDNNMINHGVQYVIESQQTTVQNSNLSTQQDALLLSMIEQLKKPNPSPSCRPTKVEVLKELPKVGMVKTSLKKLKHHHAGFDVVIKERTTTIAITEGTLGFEHTKACFRDEIIPFVKALKDIFNTFDQYLIDEFTEVQNFFYQMEQAVEQHRLESKTFEIFAITALKEELRKLKGKSVIACLKSVNKPKVIAPVVHKVDLEPLSPKLNNNRKAHVDYIRITKENVDTLRDIVEQAKTSNPLDNASPLKSEKLVAVKPMNKARKVTFAKTSTISDNNTQIHVDVHQTQTINKPSVPSTNVKYSTNASRSKPHSETKNNRIMQPLSSNQKYQKVEAHTRNAKPSLTKENSESKSVCLTCNKCYFDARHDFYVVQHLSKVNDRARAKVVKSIKMKEWKPTGKMFKNVGYKWVPTRRTFTIVGNKFPITRFTSTKIVPPRKPVKSTVITNIKPSSASQW
ncbi:hypothetical protein Tco_0427678 [Tanacetum coccineum]